MRKFPFLLLAFCLAVFFPANAHAWEVSETSAKTVEVVGEVEFTSFFCNYLDGEIITIEITPTDPVEIIASVIFIKATPHLKTNRSWAESFAVTSYTADVTLFKVSEKTHTIHLWLYLSTGEHIGVNAHF